MKTKIISLLLVLICAVSLASCKNGGAEDIVGTWKTENVGYYTITTFNEDGSFTSVYTVSDSQAAEAYGITQEILDSMNTESFYAFVPESELTPEEKEAAAGRHAIKVFGSREEMESAMDTSASYTGGILSFYTIDGDTLTLDGCIFERTK